MDRINEQEVRLKVIDFLVNKKGFPQEAIVQEMVIPFNKNNQRYIADIVLLNIEKKEYIGIIELKNKIDNKVLQGSALQVNNYLTVLNKNTMSAYLIGFSETNQLVIYTNTLSVNKYWTEINEAAFPTYKLLTLVETSKNEKLKKEKKKRNINYFLWLCLLLALVTILFLVLSIFYKIKLDDNEMKLLFISIALVIIPFVAKLEIFGIVFERVKKDD